MNKYIKDGMVAVVISPGWGAGWSTWAEPNQSKTLAFDKEIVQAVLDGDNDKAAEIAKTKVGDFYDGGKDNLVVEWLPEGSAFQIHEYDGYESIKTVADLDYVA